jgi:hypothetical protein
VIQTVKMLVKYYVRMDVPINALDVQMSAHLVQMNAEEHVVEILVKMAVGVDARHCVKVVQDVIYCVRMVA